LTVFKSKKGEDKMKTKTMIKKSVFLVGLLTLLISFSSVAPAVVLDDDVNQEEQLTVIDRIASREETGKKIPEYAPGEVIIKLKAKDGLRLLSEMSYSERAAEDTSTLSRLKSKYSLRDEKPVFKGLHNRLKAQNAGHEAVRVQTSTTVDLLPIYVVRTDADVLEACAELNKDPDVEYAEPNYIMKVQMVPDDPYYNSSGSWGHDYDDLWGIKKIQCEPAWDLSQGEGVVVAVIDTGVDYNHRDLAENIWINEDEIPDNGIDDDENGYIDDIRGWNFEYDINNPSDGHGHGTHCAGTIAAIGNNGIGVIGVAPRAKIMPVKGLDINGSGTTTDLARCVIYAADNGADVLSNSWGGIVSSQTVTEAFDYAYNSGCVSIAAAGNSDWDVVNFMPANIQTVIAVAATDQNDKRTYFSNYGKMVDVSAPGGGVDEFDIYNILSLSARRQYNEIIRWRPHLLVGAGEDDLYLRIAGTSMACPHVAGAAAAILSAFPEASPDEVRARLRLGAEAIDASNAGYEGLLGTGRINLERSLSLPEQPYFMLQRYWIEGHMAAGNTIKLIVELKNLLGDARSVWLNLEASDPKATVVEGAVDLGDVLSGAVVDNAACPFVIEFSPLLNAGDKVLFELAIEDADGFSMEITIDLYEGIFKDVRDETGLDFTIGFFSNLSVAFSDLNLDDYPDLLLGRKTLLYDSENGSFELDDFSLPTNQFTCTGDIDNDGDMDLVVPGVFTSGGLYLYENNGPGADPIFTDITAQSGIAIDNHTPYHVTFVDYDNDGYLDIITAGGHVWPYACSIFRNLGNNTFEDATRSAGITVGYRRNGGPLVTIIDYNLDGNMDVLVGGDGGVYLYENNGDGTFSRKIDIGLDNNGHRGATVGDYDNDGYPDIYLGFCDPWGPPYSKLFRNNGNGTFQDVTEASGAVGQRYIAFWGTGFFDWDNNGFLDLYVASAGFGPDTVFSNGLFHNDGTGHFTDLTDISHAKGSLWNFDAFGDYDNDGDIDIANLPIIFDDKLNLYQNQLDFLSENHWLKIHLRGTASNLFGLGARIVVTAGGLVQTRTLVSSENLAASPLIVGLGGHGQVDSIEVFWPSGIRQVLTDIEADQAITVYEATDLYFDPLPLMQTKAMESIGFTVTAHSRTGPGTGVTLTVLDLPPGSTFADNHDGTGIFSWTPNEDQDGRHLLSIQASDGVSSIVKKVPIAVDPLNFPPEFDQQLITYLQEYGGYTTQKGIWSSRSYYVLDAEGDPLTVWLTNAQDCIELTYNPETNRLSLSPLGNSSPPGLYTDIQLSASDGVNPPITLTFFVRIAQKPVVSGPQSVSAGTLKEVSFEVTASDPMGDPIVDFREVGGPMGMRLTPGSRFEVNEDNTVGRFTWIPTQAQVKTYNTSFRATNDKGGYGWLATTITVLPNNSSEIDPVGDKTAVVGKELRFQVRATDPDDDKMTLSPGVTLPEGTEFNIISSVPGEIIGEFTWTPHEDQVNLYMLEFKADDKRGGVSTTSVNIDVINNRPPVLDPIGDKDVEEGKLLTFTIRATDPEGDALTFPEPDLPDGAEFTDSGDNTASFTWTPIHEQIGEHEVTFTVSDGELEDSETIIITVLPVQVISIELEPATIALTGVMLNSGKVRMIKVHNRGNVAVEVDIGYADPLPADGIRPGLKQDIDTFVTGVDDNKIPPGERIEIPSNGIDPGGTLRFSFQYYAPTGLSSPDIKGHYQEYELRAYPAAE